MNYLMTRLLKNNLKDGWLNIIGLAFGFGCFIIITIWFFNEFKYDKSIEDLDNLYRITRQEQSPEGDILDAATTPSLLGPTLAERIPEIKSFARFYRIEAYLGEVHTKGNDEEFYENNLCFTDPELFSLFPIRFLYGDRKTCFEDPNSIILTEATALRYFGNINPVGHIIDVAELGNYIVKGVVKSPASSHMTFDFLCPLEPLIESNSWMSRWNIPHFYTYLKLARGVDPELIKVKTNKIIKEINDESLAALNTSYNYQPVRDIHLHSELSHELEGNGKNILSTLRIFIVFASFVLLISCVNFMIIYIARSYDKAGEIALRKAFGAGRFSIIKMIYVLILSLIISGFMLGVFLVMCLIPYFNSLLDISLDLNTLYDYRIILFFGLLIIICSLIAGYYPALHISSYNPIIAMKGYTYNSGKRIGFLKYFVGLQYVLSLFFIIGSIVYFSQYSFITSKDLGYSPNNIICARNNADIKQHYDAFKNSLTSYPGILSISQCSNLPMDTRKRTIVSGWEGAGQNDQVLIAYIYVDEDYLETMEITLNEGRDFKLGSDIENGFLINEEAKEQMKLKDPVGKSFILNSEEGYIIGVVKNFNLGSLADNIEPLVLKVESRYSKFLLFKLAGTGRTESMTILQKTFNEFSKEFHFEGWELEASLRNMYHDHRKASTLILIFSILGILISSFGLYGLVEYSLRRRVKEIGVRKTLGALPATIIKIFLKEYGIIILYTSIISWIAAYVYYSRWLESYAFRISIKSWYFLSASTIVLLLTSIIIIVKSIHTARTKPSSLIQSQ